jgi:hypothetical protein
MQMKTVTTLSTRWVLMLRLLDGHRAGESLVSMQPVLGQCAADYNLADLFDQAVELVEGGYRSLPVIPDGKPLQGKPGA